MRMGAVVPAGSAWVGVAGEVLDVAERDSAVEGGGDGRVAPQRCVARHHEAGTRGAAGIRAQLA